MQETDLGLEQFLHHAIVARGEQLFTIGRDGHPRVATPLHDVLRQALARHRVPLVHCPVQAGRNETGINRILLLYHTTQSKQ